MRRSRGPWWAKNRQRSRFNQNNQQRNFNNSRNSPQMPMEIPNIKNLTYIGRCRCGFGPNAYYKDTKGNVVNVNNLNPSPQIKIQNSDIIPLKRQSTRMSPLTSETYCNRCGSKVRDDAYFCTECGNELIYSAIPTPTKKEQINILKNRIRELKKQIKEIKKNG